MHLDNELKEYFLSYKDKLHEKRTLLTLFTKTVLPVLHGFEGQKEFMHKYDCQDYLDTIFFIKDKGPINESPYIPDPKRPVHVQDDYVTLPYDKSIKPGDKIVVNDEAFTVVSFFIVNKIKNHPFSHKMDENTFNMFKEIGKLSVLRVDKDNRRLPNEDDDIYMVKYQDSSHVKDFEQIAISVKKIGRIGNAPFSIFDTMEIDNNDIVNLEDTTTTTLGNYTLNKVILADVFGSKIPYFKNVEGKPAIKPGELDTKVTDLILSGQAGRKEYDLYMQRGYFIGHLTQLSVPGLSRKSMTTSPEALALKEKLFKEHAHELDDPIVMTKIEKQLIDEDRKWLADDPVYRLFAVTDKKTYNEHRKKMFLTFGVGVEFSEKGGRYQTITNSLSEGMIANDIPKLADEQRRGAYERGKGTAKGGEQTDLLVRFLNSIKITQDDCGTDRGIEITLTKENMKAFLGTYILETKEALSEGNIDKYLGKTVTFRDPQYCKTKGQICMKCAGELYKTLNSRSIGMEVLKIGSKFTSINMKSMHFSGISNNTLNDIGNYFI